MFLFSDLVFCKYKIGYINLISNKLFYIVCVLILRIVMKIYKVKLMPVSILVDNQEPRLSAKGTDFDKFRGVIILSFPPHYSHEL